MLLFSVRASLEFWKFDQLTTNEPTSGRLPTALGSPVVEYGPVGIIIRCCDNDVAVMGGDGRGFPFHASSNITGGGTRVGLKSIASFCLSHDHPDEGFTFSFSFF